MTTTMRHAIIKELAPYQDALLVENAPQPMPGPDEALIRMRAGAVNYPDVLMTEHKYQFKPPLPFVPGMEGAGEIVECPSTFSGFSPGDRVVVKKRFGLFAEFVTATEEQLHPVPGAYDFAEAAAFSVIYHTAYNALVVRGNLKSGETLVVLGAAGGVGLAAVELGVHLGAHVIACASRDDKLTAARAYGAQACINYETEDYRQALMEHTGGRGADVIYDPVGGDLFEASLRCLNFEGRLLVIGFTSGGYGQVKANYPLLKGASVIGCRAGEWGRNFPDAGAAQDKAVMQLADSGTLKPHISHRIPLEEIAEAYRLLDHREVVGKAVVTL